MRGFAVPRGDNLYREFIRVVADTANREWPKRKISFAKFGTEIAQIAQDGRSAPLHLEFYGGQGFRDTRIDTVLESTTPTDLNLIVTDLFQNEGDVGLVTRSLVNKYLSQRLAMAVLGIRTAFDGNVFDIQATPGGFLHRGLRPCYVLVLGPSDEVARYVESLDAALGRGGISERHSVGIGMSRIRSVQPGSLLALPTYDSIKRREIAKARFDRLDLTDENVRDPRVYQFRVAGVNGFPARFQLDAGLELNPLTGQFPRTVAPIIISEMFDGKKQFVEAPDASQAIHLSQAKGPDPVFQKNSSLQRGSRLELHYTGELSTLRLRKDRIYRFEIRLVPDAELPDWVKDWDMPRASDTGGKPVLTKTLNLMRFLNDVWTTGSVDAERLFLYITTRDSET